ncbi:MAG TPA: amidase, partial [Acidimicrobiales bacterium]|nr:amidase [Acidimicrobiales bacterium]
MTVTPWQGDACSLVDAFRTGERNPKEELEGVLAAIDASALDAVSFLDAEGARAAAARADASLPFGGVPIGVKELEPVEGWPSTEASLVFADRVADQTTTMVRRLEGAGVVKIAQTTASEFGGLNVSVSKLHGVTHNPWRHDRTAGGSSGGSAAAVAGGLLPIATGGDGGGSIRIPAGLCGLVGMKGTAGRIPRGPRTEIAPLTVVVGCVARSVRDVARWFDVCSGYHPRDPYSLPRVDGWERDLGTCDLRGLSAVIAPDLGNAVVLPRVEARVREAGEALARDAGLRLVDVPVRLPGLGFEWAMANLSQLRKALGDRWPACKDDLTLEMAFGLDLADQVFNLEMAGRVEAQRTEANERMADLFDDVDFVICATNPDVAFPAEIGLNTRVGNLSVGPE